MKNLNLYLLLLATLSIVSCATPKKSTSESMAVNNTAATEILLLGSVHFTQIHDTASATQNFLSPKRQQEIAEVNKLLKAFSPDMIMIEREPKEQAKYDSLFQLFHANQLNLEQLEGGTGEIYQLGFRLAKDLGHQKLHCIDYYASTSQSLLASGQNMDKYQAGLQNFQKITRGISADFKSGTVSLKDFLITLNKPETIELSHHQFYNLPAYVQNGSFKNYDGLDKESIDTTYIGAEFISLFYDRNLKIYSNILNAQYKNKGKRIILIMGQTHIGVLQDLLDNNPEFRIVNANQYLAKSMN